MPAAGCARHEPGAPGEDLTAALGGELLGAQVALERAVARAVEKDELLPPLLVDARPAGRVDDDQLPRDPRNLAEEPLQLVPFDTGV